MTFAELSPGSWFLIKVELGGDFTRLYIKIQDEKAIDLNTGQIKSVADECRVIKIIS